jgi:hypothetical protein
MSLERRRSFRTALATKVRLCHRGESARVLMTSDLGPRGLFLRSTQPLRVNELVEMEIHLPGYARPVQADGQIARSHAGGVEGQSGMGVRFTRVGNDDAGRLNKFFSAHHTLNGCRVVMVSDDPFELRDIARAVAREGLNPQLLRWNDPAPPLDPSVCAFIVVPSGSGQAEGFAAVRRSYGMARPGLLAILKDENYASEWLRSASVCVHGMPEPDRAAALTLFVAIAPGAALEAIS